LQLLELQLILLVILQMSFLSNLFQWMAKEVILAISGSRDVTHCLPRLGYVKEQYGSSEKIHNL
jgi:hypothetical protein